MSSTIPLHNKNGHVVALRHSSGEEKPRSETIEAETGVLSISPLTNYPKAATEKYVVDERDFPFIVTASFAISKIGRTSKQRDDTYSSTTKQKSIESFLKERFDTNVCRHSETSWRDALTSLYPELLYQPKRTQINGLSLFPPLSTTPVNDSTDLKVEVVNNRSIPAFNDPSHAPDVIDKDRAPSDASEAWDNVLSQCYPELLHQPRRKNLHNPMNNFKIMPESRQWKLNMLHTHRKRYANIKEERKAHRETVRNARNKLRRSRETLIEKTKQKGKQRPQPFESNNEAIHTPGLYTGTQVLDQAKVAPERKVGMKKDNHEHISIVDLVDIAQFKKNVPTQVYSERHREEIDKEKINGDEERDEINNEIIKINQYERRHREAMPAEPKIQQVSLTEARIRNKSAYMILHERLAHFRNRDKAPNADVAHMVGNNVNKEGKDLSEPFTKDRGSSKTTSCIPKLQQGSPIRRTEYAKSINRARDKEFPPHHENTTGERPLTLGESLSRQRFTTFPPSQEKVESNLLDRQKYSTKVQQEEPKCQGKSAHKMNLKEKRKSYETGLKALKSKSKVSVLQSWRYKSGTILDKS